MSSEGVKKVLEMEELTPTELVPAITSCTLAGQPTFTWGPPGIGKSDIHQQVAIALGMEFRDVRALLLDPVDLRGLPYFKDGQVHWAPPVFLPTGGKGMLFLDELNAAPQLTQAACYQLVLKPHKIGEYQLPPDWIVMAAGNRETDRAVTSRMPSALANRFVHFFLKVDKEDWIKWALTAGVLPEVIAFIRWRPNLLYAFDPNKNEKAFPTPRSWEFISNLLKNGQVPPEIEPDVMSGAIGRGAAAELLSFLKIFRKLPDPQMVLMHPTTSKVPDDPATLFALCTALGNFANEQNFSNLCKYIDRIPAEFGVMTISDAVKRDERITKTMAWIEWASKNSDVLLPKR